MTGYGDQDALDFSHQVSSTEQQGLYQSMVNSYCKMLQIIGRFCKIVRTIISAVAKAI